MLINLKHKLVVIIIIFFITSTISIVSVAQPRIIGKTVEEDSLNTNQNEYTDNEKNITDPWGGMVTVKGYWYYKDKNGSELPVKYAAVYAFDDDVGNDEYLGMTTTDNNGYWEITDITNLDDEYIPWPFGDGDKGLDIFIMLGSATDKIKVTDYNGNYYSWGGIHNKQSNVDNGTVDFGILQIPTSSYYYETQKAMWIYQTIVRGYAYLEDAASNPGKCTVEWQQDGIGDSYYVTGGNVHLVATDAGYPDEILHEVAKNYMCNVYGYWLPDNLKLISHNISKNCEIMTAWLEGWAYFFPLAVYNKNYFSGYNFGAYLESPPTSWENGDDVSGRVAAALWDIYDSQNDGSDYCNEGFGRIWDVIYNQNDNNFSEFWSAWKSRGQPQHCAVSAIYQNTIDYDNAPIIANLPDITLMENTSLWHTIDLWAHASDIESQDSQISYSIFKNSNFNCGVRIDENRYISMNPTHDWYGYSDVVIQVNDLVKTDRDTFRITVIAAPPVADFNANPIMGHLPLIVQFTDLSKNRVTNWLWNFGDGITSTLQHPSHQYNFAGTYTISLTVTGPGGANSITKADYIFVNTLPTATNLTLTPERPKSSDILICNYTYNDNDGHPESGTEIRWFNKGRPQSELNDSLTVHSKYTSCGELWYYTVTPHDGYEFGETETSPEVTINTPPTVSSLEIVPTNPMDTDDLAAKYVYEDDETDPESDSEIRWYKNGLLQAELNDQTNVPCEKTTAGDQWYFIVQPNDGLEFGTQQASAVVNIDMLEIIEAETMQNCIERYGCFCEDGWRLTHQNQPIYEELCLPADFYYHVTVIAKGEIAGGAAPWMKLQIGDEFKGTREVYSTDWQEYSFYATVSAGNKELSLTYLNDWWNSSVGDRNLLVDKIKIQCQFDQPLATRYVFEAENMKCQHPQNYQQDEFMVLIRPYAFVGQDMYFEKPELIGEVFAKANSTAGVWPHMEIRLDDLIINSFDVDTPIPQTYQFNLSNMQAGEHRIKITYNDESWAYERKLYIDKLILHTDDGSLLQTLASTANDENMLTKLPETFLLEQNYPNPFNQTTCILYQLPQECFVTIKIYNTMSQELATIVNEYKPAGYYQTFWNGMDENSHVVVSGIYLCKIQAGDYICVKKLALMK